VPALGCFGLTRIGRSRGGLHDRGHEHGLEAGTSYCVVLTGYRDAAPDDLAQGMLVTIRMSRLRPRRSVRATAVVVLVVTGLSVAAAATAASWHYSLPEPGVSEPEVRLYAGAEMVGVIYPSHKAQTWMSLEKIPREVIDAVLTAEDRRFWTHPGIDPVAVARAFHVNLKQNEVRQGGSTITQQVARTVFLDTRRTWTR